MLRWISTTAALLAVTSAATAASNLIVTAPSGTYVGLIAGSAPEVRQFRSIPFALPPTGERRWLPPTPITAVNTSTRYDSTSYPPSCPQYLGSTPNLFNTIVPEWIINTPGQNKTAGAYADSSAEDCLYLAVWTPSKCEEKLPVLLFMTGGGFSSGGVDIPYQFPTDWVQRTQSHIVVTINYRVNIMGFPGAAGLADANPGLLDQRTAMEWVRSNIAAFGGDPQRIILWGQSAGAISTEFQSFIQYQDPIAAGYVMTSGSFGTGLTNSDAAGTSFSKVAAAVGCGNVTSSAAELACMRQATVRDIVTAASTTSGVTFNPLQDNRTAFSNYTDLYVKGVFAQKPAIYSFCQNDGLAVLPYPKNPADPNAINATDLQAATASAFQCPAARSAALRSLYQKSVYRYQFVGNFSNIAPAPWLGPYHDADLALIMSTHDDFRGASTAYEYKVAEALQDKILAFARDPAGSQDWPTADSGQMLRFGADGGPAVQIVSESEVDAICST